MDLPSVERKLTTILHADVHGYSRLMGADEVATLRTLTAYRQVTDPLIQQHRGRVVGSAGDSILAEFASVVEAVQCAIEIQQTLKAKNNELSPDRRMEFRIGINLGDVMVEGEQIYGDGVNIAARLEGLAEPGGVCIAGAVYEQIKNKLALKYEDLGEQRVKNIAEPVRMWRIRLEESESPKSEVRSPESKSDSHKPRRVGITYRHWAMVAGLLLIAATIVAVRYFSRPPLSTQDSALRTQAAPAALPLPDKPSIVVLPFMNISEDPKQEYFSDGLTEDLTSGLSKISSLFVIARNSAFTYKGKAAKVQDISKELGVRYVLEGSVRKAEDQVRIATQLIDGTTGGHLWSERYDRPLKDIFALQDEIVQKIVTTLKLQLALWEQGFISVRKRTDSLEAYDYYLRGADLSNRVTKETNVQARQMFEKAIELDSQYAQAYADLSWTYYWEWFLQWSQDPQASGRAFELAQKAVALDDSLPQAHVLLGVLYQWVKRQHEQAIAEAERAVALDPNNTLALSSLGDILGFAGRPAEGIELVKKAMRLNPHYPAFFANTLGWSCLLTERYEEAVAAFKDAIARNPNFPPAHVNLAVTYSELGREVEARAEVAEVLRITPHASLEVWRRMVPFKDPAIVERLADGLRKAGLK